MWDPMVQQSALNISIISHIFGLGEFWSDDQGALCIPAFPQRGKSIRKISLLEPGGEGREGGAQHTCV